MEQECAEVLSLLNIKTYQDLHRVLNSSDESDIIKKASEICYNRKNDGNRTLQNLLKNIHRDIDGTGDDDNIDHTLAHYRRQQSILQNYHNLRWRKAELRNECELDPVKPFVATLNPTQKFLLEYFKPSSPQKGMLLWHSVGSGKTCTIVNLCSGYFEEENYRIIFVTRSSLKNDIYKNIFETVCHHRLRDMEKIKTTKDSKTKKNKKSPKDGGNNKFAMLPVSSNSVNVVEEKIPAEMKHLLNEKLWFPEPLSYNQLFNLCLKLNKKEKAQTPIFEHIMNDKRHENDPEGKSRQKADPFYKTLLVIDEAQYLFKNEDGVVKKSEEGEAKKMREKGLEAIHKILMNSYRISGENSAKVLLLTATPMYNNPYEFIQLMNLLRPEEKQININESAFLSMIKRDIEQDKIDNSNHYEMLNFIGKHFSGYVSYLDRSNDPSQFALVNKTQFINVPMTKAQEIKVKDKLGIKPNQAPISGSKKVMKKDDNDLVTQIRSILSDNDFRTYFNLMKLKSTIPEIQYKSQMTKLFSNYPNILNLHLMNI